MVNGKVFLAFLYLLSHDLGFFVSLFLRVDRSAVAACEFNNLAKVLPWTIFTAVKSDWLRLTTTASLLFHPFQ